MKKAKVIDLQFYKSYPGNGKENRYILHIKYEGTLYYLDVTDELVNCEIDFTEDNIRKLKLALPDHVLASFNEQQFRISKESMDIWINKYKGDN